VKQAAIPPLAKTNVRFVNPAFIVRRQLLSQRSAQVELIHQWVKVLVKYALQAHIALRDPNQSLCAKVVLIARNRKRYALIVNRGIIALCVQLP